MDHLKVDVVSMGLSPSLNMSSLLDFPIPTMSEKKTLLARKPDKISPSVWMFVRGAEKWHRISHQQGGKTSSSILINLVFIGSTGFLDFTGLI